MTDARPRPSSNTLREYGVLLGMVLAGLAVYACFRALQVEGAASIAAYTVLVVWIGLSFASIQLLIADAASRRPDILRDGENEQRWIEAFRGVEDSALGHVGEAFGVSISVMFVAFVAYSAAVENDWQPTRLGITILIAINVAIVTAMSLGRIFRGRGGWIKTHLPRILKPRLVNGQLWFGAPETTLPCALIFFFGYIPERIVGTTSRGWFVYTMTGLVMWTFIIGVAICSTVGGNKLAILLAATTSKLSSNTRRLPWLQAESRYLIRWLQLVMQWQTARHVGTAIITSALVDQIARLVEPVLLFTLLVLIALLGPLGAAVSLARTYDRRAFTSYPGVSFALQQPTPLSFPRR